MFIQSVFKIGLLWLHILFYELMSSGGTVEEETEKKTNLERMELNLEPNYVFIYTLNHPAGYAAGWQPEYWEDSVAQFLHLDILIYELGVRAARIIDTLYCNTVLQNHV